MTELTGIDEFNWALRMTTSIIPAETAIGRHLRDAATARRILLMAGLPSTGKSLMLQQLIILASEAGRHVHTLQWDDARSAFETQDWLQVFPEVDGVTHPGIRRAIGLWVRRAVATWHNQHQSRSDILIVELPVVGGRFAELLQPVNDDAEPLLKSQDTLVLVPVPTNKMRYVITGIRAETSRNPRNEFEARDAPPHIVESSWAEIRRLYIEWNVIADESEVDERYQEAICRSVFEHLCRYRHLQILSIDREYPTTGSAYERSTTTQAVRASSQDVAAAYAQLMQLHPNQPAQLWIENWSEY